MLPEMELLQYIYKTADMGCAGIRAVEERAGDNLKAELKQEKDEYAQICTQAGRMIRQRGDEPEGVGPIAKMSANMMSAGQLAMDDSRSRIAEMMIQGITMGIVKTIRHLKDYPKDDEPRRLAQKLLDTQQKNVETMKRFL